ncbi:hypothetical protein FraQA3DRAFT_2192 [Frankia sp. QA3]|nr:hypothetical protein FraQA3DRAFT_2192 [Frankia sp. QA3]
MTAPGPVVDCTVLHTGPSGPALVEAVTDVSADTGFTR